MHQQSRGIEHHGNDQAHTQYGQRRLKQATQDLSIAALFLLAQVKQFFDHRCDRKRKTCSEANQRHTPIYFGNGSIGEENIDQIVIVTIIRDLTQTGHDLEHAIQQVNDPTAAYRDVI